MLKLFLFLCMSFSIITANSDTLNDLNTPRSVGPTNQFEKSLKFRMQEYNYFIFGFDGESSSIEYKNQVKFLISLRFRLFENQYDSLIIPVKFKKITKKIVYNKSFNFDLGFRQKGFWNLYDNSSSSPIYENNYSPSFYFSWANIFKNKLPFAILAGYIHESNGLAELQSRSWDRVYAGMSIGNLQFNLLTCQLDMWVPIGLEENPGIYEYYGIGELSLFYQPLFKYQHPLSNIGLTASWKLASKNINNIELGLLYSPFQFANNFLTLFTPTFYFQLYMGSGENLLDYEKRHTSARLGLATLY